MGGRWEKRGEEKRAAWCISRSGYGRGREGKKMEGKRLEEKMGRKRRKIK